MMIKPSGMSGACSITVPTPNVCRRITGDERRWVIRNASVPVGEEKSLFKNALFLFPLTTSSTTAALLARFEFVNLRAASDTSGTVSGGVKAFRSIRVFSAVTWSRRWPKSARRAEWFGKADLRESPRFRPTILPWRYDRTYWPLPPCLRKSLKFCHMDTPRNGLARLSANL